jgi:carbon storage regulator
LEHLPVELPVREFKEESIMLVLSRKQDEEIIIAGNIRIKVIRLSGNRVQLGITAADDIPIERAERLEKDQDSNLSPLAEVSSQVQEEGAAEMALPKKGLAPVAMREESDAKQCGEGFRRRFEAKPAEVTSNASETAPRKADSVGRTSSPRLLRLLDVSPQSPRDGQLRARKTSEGISRKPSMRHQ